MDSSSMERRTLSDYRVVESEFHRTLMKVCRNYLNDLSIISMTGILDIVKQEVVDLEKATKKSIRKDPVSDLDKNEIPEEASTGLI